jgi:hypothetical protein
VLVPELGYFISVLSNLLHHVRDVACPTLERGNGLPALWIDYLKCVSSQSLQLSFCCG